VIVNWETTAVSDDHPKRWSGTATDIVRKQRDGTWKIVLDNPHGIE